MSNWQRDLLTIVFESKFMSLATSDANGLPWISPLVYGCDEQLRFYWASAQDARHSLNVLANPRAALAIYDSKQRPNISIQGFYSEGSVEELSGTELERATRIFYGWRYPVVHLLAEKLRGPEHFQGTAYRRMYRLNTSQTYGLDPAGHPIWGTKLDMRVDVSIHSEFAARYAKDLSHLLK